MWLSAPPNIWRSSMQALDSNWRPRRDLNPCYRRENFGTLGNAYRTPIEPTQKCFIHCEFHFVGTPFFADLLAPDAFEAGSYERNIEPARSTISSYGYSGRTRSQACRSCSNVDPILQAMIASKHGVSSALLLSLRPAFLWVSRDSLRYPRTAVSRAHPNYPHRLLVHPSTSRHCARTCLRRFSFGEIKWNSQLMNDLCVI